MRVFRGLRASERRAFTLIELVVVIIGLGDGSVRMVSESVSLRTWVEGKPRTR